MLAVVNLPPVIDTFISCFSFPKSYTATALPNLLLTFIVPPVIVKLSLLPSSAFEIYVPPRTAIASGNHTFPSIA